MLNSRVAQRVSEELAALRFEPADDLTISKAVWKFQDLRSIREIAE